MKTVCIYHSIDLDGWMSAAIVKHYFTTERKGGTQDYIGYNYGQPIPDLSEYDRVIMCDISFKTKDLSVEAIQPMINLYERYGSNFIWIDHHISVINDVFNYANKYEYDLDLPCGLRDTKFAACELTWKYFFPDKPMPELVRFLGRYDCFGHKGTDEEQKVLEFQYGARETIDNYEEAYKCLIDSINGRVKGIRYADSIEGVIWKSGAPIYRYLCTEAKQTYKNGFEIELSEPFMNITRDNFGKQISTLRRKFICINKERFNPVNFGIDYHKDGYDGCACFWYANGKWNFSVYNDNGEVDCTLIAKQFDGGGHKGASGFILDNEQFNKLMFKSE